MKIKNIKYNKRDKHIQVNVEGYSDLTFCFDIREIESKQDLLTKLQERLNIIDAKKTEITEGATKYNNLHLESLKI